MDLNIKFISKFNDGVTDRGCLHYAILNALYGFKQKRAHKVREIFPSKYSKGDFQDFENV